MSFFTEEAKHSKLKILLDKIVRTVPGEVSVWGDAECMSCNVRPKIDYDELKVLLSGAGYPELHDFITKLVITLSNRSNWEVVKDEQYPSGYKCTIAQETLERGARQILIYNIVRYTTNRDNKLRDFIFRQESWVHSKFLNFLVELVPFYVIYDWRWELREGCEAALNEAFRVMKNICIMEGYSDKKSNKRRR